MFWSLWGDLRGCQKFAGYVGGCKGEEARATRGTSEVGNETALTKGYLRRRLSSATIKADMACLLERLVQVEEGGGQGGKIRLWARQEEERAQLDRES